VTGWLIAFAGLCAAASLLIVAALLQALRDGGRDDHLSGRD
jgi:hypothetical protein